MTTTIINKTETQKQYQRSIVRLLKQIANKERITFKESLIIDITPVNNKEDK